MVLSQESIMEKSQVGSLLMGTSKVCTFASLRAMMADSSFCRSSADTIARACSTGM